MKWKDQGVNLMYLLIVLFIWVLSSLLRQNTRAEYMKYLLASSLR
jgi:hypothetical protein